MSTEIYSAIEAALTADQTDDSLYDDVGGRIYRDQLPNDGRYPALRVAIVADPLIARLQNDARTTDVQIDIYGARGSAATLAAINVKLRALLHRVKLAITGFSGGEALALDYGTTIAEPDVARLMTRYRIWTNE